jgi:hypothetical protein
MQFEWISISRGGKHNKDANKFKNRICVLASNDLFRLFYRWDAGVSALVIVLSNSPCERIGKWGMFHFWKRVECN